MNGFLQMTKLSDTEDAGWKHEKTVQIPDGYVRYDGDGSPITIIERENSDTPNGSRYEFWVPIKKVD